MKYPGLIIASLALSSPIVNAASESTFSGDILHIPHVIYLEKTYDVTMKFQAPDKLILQTATPLQIKPENPAVKVSKKLKFKLTDIDAGVGQPYRADVKFKDNVFTASGITLALHGKMHKGEKITALGWLADGSYSYAYSISENGKSITGRSRTADKKTVPVRFHHDTGELETLNNLPGENDIARATNNSGAIAGYGGSLKKVKGVPTTYNAFYNKTGKDLINIGTLGQGKDSRAYGINNNDVIVGWSASNAGNTDHVAFSYDAKSSTMTGLGANILGGTRSFAFAVNDSGQIAGVALTADSSAVAFVYNNGATKNLGSFDNSGYSEARAINDKGHAVGWSLTASGSYHAFIHDGTTMKKIPGLGNGDSKAYGINTHGHVVGDARDEKGGRHAFVYKDGQAIDLYALLPPADKEKWKELREAFSISDDGVVVGRGRFWKNKEKSDDSSMAFRIQL